MLEGSITVAGEAFEAAKEAWRQGDRDHGRFRLPPGDEDEFIPLPDNLK